MFDFHGPRIDVSDLTEAFEELRDARGNLDELREAVEEAQIAYNDACAALEDGEGSESDCEDAADTLAGARKDLQEAEAWAEQNPEDAAALATLESVLDDLRDSGGGDHQFEGDWFPGYLIADSDFEDYARELAEDIGAIPDDAQWPCTCIDWEKAARELQMDYTSIEIEGKEYLYR